MQYSFLILHFSSSPGVRIIAGVAQVVERQSKLKRPELLRYASRVMKLEDLEGESFMQKLNRLFTEAGAWPYDPQMPHFPVHAGGTK